MNEAVEDRQPQERIVEECAPAAGPPNITVAVAALLLADGRRIPLRGGVITTTALASLISEGQP